MELFGAVLSLMVLAAVSAGEPVDIDGVQGLGETRHHVVQSEILDKQYHVLVGLPEGYDEDAETRYPTLYVLDGGELYPLFTSYLRYLQFAGEAPDVIVIGISYGTSDWQNGNDRGHDYTAPTEEREHWGGAEAFQAFLGDELIPEIEREYRSRSDRRVLFGRSLGGQFVLYSAQTRPDLFWGRIASNPALHRNLPLFLSMRPDAPAAPSHLFVSSGSLDDAVFREPALAWIEHWSAQINKPWRLRTETLEGHSHFSTPAEALRRGIAWLFADYLSSSQESS